MKPAPLVEEPHGASTNRSYYQREPEVRLREP